MLGQITDSMLVLWIVSVRSVAFVKAQKEIYLLAGYRCVGGGRPRVSSASAECLVVGFVFVQRTWVVDQEAVEREKRKRKQTSRGQVDIRFDASLEKKSNAKCDTLKRSSMCLSMVKMLETARFDRLQGR